MKEKPKTVKLKNTKSGKTVTLFKKKQPVSPRYKKYA